MSIGGSQASLLLFCKSCYLRCKTLNILFASNVEVSVYVHRAGIVRRGICFGSPILLNSTSSSNVIEELSALSALPRIETMSITRTNQIKIHFVPTLLKNIFQQYCNKSLSRSRSI